MASGICQQCGGTFTPRARTQRFCSKPCAGKWQWRGHTPRTNGWGKRPSVDAAHRRLRKQLLPDALGTPCPLCRVIMDKTAQLDHIVPRAQGGTSTRDNVRIICARCNHARGSHLGRVVYARRRSRSQPRQDTPVTSVTAQASAAAPRRPRTELPRW